MSCYNWESGSIIIPAASWAGFKKALRAVYSTAIAADFEAAERAVAGAKLANKGKRGVHWRTAVSALLDAGNSNQGVFKVAEPFRVLDKLCPQGCAKPLRPKRKDFAAATNKTLVFSAGDGAAFAFDDNTHSVEWSVERNNHAVEDAHEALMAKALFSQLSRIVWTRNSGGVIAGNNEYNEDEKGEGEGANTANFRFGPLGEPRPSRW